jgi:uncharacterized protein YjdB
MSASSEARFRSAALLTAALLAAGCGRKPSVLEIGPRKVIIYGVGRTKDVTLRVLDRRGRDIPDLSPTWSSTPPGIVDVSGAGHLVAKKPGKAVVAASVGKLSTSIPVEVRDVASIEIVPALVRLVGPSGTAARLELVGRTDQGKRTTIGAVAWSSKNPRIAAVSPEGVISSVAPGKTTASAKMGDLFAEADVEVQVMEISRLEIRPETAIIHVGETEKFSVLAYDLTGNLIADSSAQFTTSNPDLVKLTGDGRATGLAKGTATISAAIGNKTARATLLVN